MRSPPATHWSSWRRIKLPSRCRRSKRACLRARRSTTAMWSRSTMSSARSTSRPAALRRRLARTAAAGGSRRALGAPPQALLPTFAGFAGSRHVGGTSVAGRETRRCRIRCRSRRDRRDRTRGRRQQTRRHRAGWRCLHQRRNTWRRSYRHASSSGSRSHRRAPPHLLRSRPLRLPGRARRARRCRRDVSESPNICSRRSTRRRISRRSTRSTCRR